MTMSFLNLKLKHTKAMRSGFTLMELIAAMTIFSFILVAGSQLDTAATRMTNTMVVESHLEQDLVYGARTFEKDLMLAKNIEKVRVPVSVQAQIAAAGGSISAISGLDLNYELLLTMPGDPPNPTDYQIRYVINMSEPGTKIFERRYKPGTPQEQITNFFRDTQLQLKHTSANLTDPASVETPLLMTGNIISLNLGLSVGVPSGGSVQSSGLTKSIYIRPGATTISEPGTSLP